MIMPCMNSTSACDRCGACPVVEAGSLLLGIPGAPGCTIGAASDCACCARISPPGNAQLSAANATDAAGPTAQRLTAAVFIVRDTLSQLTRPILDFPAHTYQIGVLTLPRHRASRASETLPKSVISAQCPQPPQRICFSQKNFRPSRAFAASHLHTLQGRLKLPFAPACLCLNDEDVS
jgi:hypothetical protein